MPRKRENPRKFVIGVRWFLPLPGLVDSASGKEYSVQTTPRMAAHGMGARNGDCSIDRDSLANEAHCAALRGHYRARGGRGPFGPGVDGPAAVAAVAVGGRTAGRSP